MAVTTLTGCSTPESSSAGEAPAKTTSEETPVCSAADVLRPPVRSDSDPPGTKYPDQPSSFNEPAVRDFLIEFETAYARNKTIQDSVVISVSVVVQGGFKIESVTGGFLAHGNVQVMYDTDVGEQTATGDIKYRANYFISDLVAHRVETMSENIDPRGESDSRIVACFE